MKKLVSLLVVFSSLFSIPRIQAGVAYSDPLGGWTYFFAGDKGTNGGAGTGFSSLDGTWSHDNGSDEWDGTAPGGTFGDENRPGGVGIFEEGGIKFLRIQDTGDPRDFGFADPGSNRKIYLGHDATAEGAPDALLDEGVTLTFRARIPTPGKSTSPLDGLHRDGQNAAGVLPYPADGDGYVTSDGGKGNFVIRQASGGAIAFSLSTLNDNGGGDPNGAKANFAGLTMNEFAGNVPSASVNFGQGTGTNVIAFDPTQWHELWIVIRKDPAGVGTHQAFIYVDGSMTPTVFKLTAGTGNDYAQSYLAIGSTATPQNSALDVDFVGYKVGATFPPGFAEPPGGWTYQYTGDKATFGESGSGFTSLDGTWSHDNGSDEWDGSAPGGAFGDGNRPGGAGIFEEGNVRFLRIQDTGDPRDFGYGDPGSNRKIYLGHDITAEGATDSVMDDGVTLSFRARIPSPSKTTNPLDGLHRDGRNAGGVLPYPNEGDGYVTSDGGKGNFVIRQASGGAIAFSLSTLNDNGGGDPNGAKANFAGLTMNEFSGTVISANVNFGQGTGTNVIAFDPTTWHSFWITIRKDPSNVGTHQAYIYLDGSLTPTIFRLTAGTGNDFAQSYLAMGSTATPQNSALDVDYYAYKLGAHFPSGAIDNLPPEVADIVPAAGTLFHSAALGVSFSATTIMNNTLPTEGFQLRLNGNDVTAGLVVSGTPQSRTVKYSGLVANTVYVAQIIAKDQAGRASTNTLAFDTIVESASVGIEAEDYNFSSGQTIDIPTTAAFLEQVGTPDIDYFDTTTEIVTAANHVYRTADFVSTVNSGDTRRAKYIDSDVQETHVGQVQTDEWLNYTRTIPAAQYNAYLRAATATPKQVRLDRVTGNPTQPNQTTVPLGTFNLPAGGPNSFVYTALTAADGAVATLDLTGKQTFRLTFLGAANNLLVNHFILVPAPATVITPPKKVTLSGAKLVGTQVQFTFEAEAGKSYRVEYHDSLNTTGWKVLSNINGAAAGTQTISDPATTDAQRFYRVQSL